MIENTLEALKVSQVLQNKNKNPTRINTAYSILFTFIIGLFEYTHRRCKKYNTDARDFTLSIS